MALPGRARQLVVFPRGFGRLARLLGRTLVCVKRAERNASRGARTSVMHILVAAAHGYPQCDSRETRRASDARCGPQSRASDRSHAWPRTARIDKGNPK